VKYFAKNEFFKIFDSDFSKKEKKFERTFFEKIFIEHQKSLVSNCCKHQK